MGDGNHDPATQQWCLSYVLSYIMFIRNVTYYIMELFVFLKFIGEALLLQNMTVLGNRIFKKVIKLI